MNLYGRFILFVINAIFCKKNFAPFNVVSSHFRVWLFDIDLNMHLTSARYFSFGDISRLNWMAKNGLMKSFLSSGMRAVVNAQEITYIREFRPFSKIELQVELISFDEKYGYFEQRFYHGEKLHAISHVRTAFLLKGKVVPCAEYFKSLGLSVESPSQSDSITQWKHTLQAKKVQFS